MLELARDQLWTDYQDMSVLGIPLGRRLAVARGSAGQLVVFSPLEATPAAIGDLKTFGDIAAFVVPSRFHDRYYEGYFAEFPRARFLASRAVIEDHPQWPLTELSATLPELAGFTVEMLEGAPKVQEQVFVHHASRTLIIADAFFNLPLSDDWAVRTMMKLADIGGSPPRPSRLFRSSIRDRAAFAASVRRVLEHDFDRIMPGHGEIVAREGKTVLRTAFAELLQG
jgi:hypothetical protein